MTNTYNAKLSFVGEGSFSFVLPDYGELTIYPNKDIYVKGLSVNGVEALRQLRPLLLNHQLNAKPDGCYKVIDLTKYSNKITGTFERAYKEPVKSVADLKSELVRTTGPIPVEELISNTETTETNPKIDEAIEVTSADKEPKTNSSTKSTKRTKKSSTKKSKKK